MARFAALAALALGVAEARTRDSFDFGWLFHLGDVSGWAPTCDTSGFTTNLTGVQCYGFSQAAASDAASCAAQACNDNLLVWQWCPFGATDCDAPGECWVGSDCSDNATNSGTAGWVSAGRATVPPPAPVPPCANSTLPCNTDYNDQTADWVAKNVPHDFVVDGQFSPTNDRGHGYLAGNQSWYRKHFTVDPSYQGQLIWLEFGGVFRNADVWLNNAYLGHHTEGYTSFNFFIHNTSSPLNYGSSENVLAIRCDATAPELWSYEPGGIFRHVYLHTANPVSVVPWGFYSPAFIAGNISGGGSEQQTADLVQLNPVVDVANAGTASAAVTLAYALVDAQGNTVAKASAQVTLGPGAWSRQRLPTSVGSDAAPVNLWNTAVPYLYNATLTVSVGGAVVDTVWARVGIRSAVFDPFQGFVLNGVRTPISGTSNHIDFGGTGGAVPDRVNEFRVATHRKVLGGNGWRTAHNPVAPEMLDFADEYGLLIWEENRFINAGVQPLAPKPVPDSRRGEKGVWEAWLAAEDGTPSSLVSSAGVSPTWWHRFAPSRNGGLWTGKPSASSSASGPTQVDAQLLQDAQDMVLRDRNHPSIVIWSLCNEGGCEQGAQWGGVVFAQFLTSISFADTMRPVTGNSEWDPTSSDTFTQVSQVMSFSYNYGAYSTYRQFHPNKPVGGGESASCTSTRQYYLPSNSTSGWVNQNDFGCVQTAWASAANLEYVFGNFAWTGYDYKGEPTPMNWPCINSHFGIMDIAGFPKDSIGYYRAWWVGACDEVNLSPSHWTAPVPVGTKINVVAFSCAATVQLFLNGVAQSGSPMPVPSLGYVTFQGVTYAPGNLTAVSYDATGAVAATRTLLTAGTGVSLNLWVESPYNAPRNGSVIAADGQDVALLGVEVLDASGLRTFINNFNVSFTTAGPGYVYGVANGDPSDHSPDHASWRLTFGGVARAIIASSGAGMTGSITVTASAPGLQPASVTLTAQ